MKKTAYKHIIGLKELRMRTGAYITRVEKGESFIVVRRSRPIFALSPVGEEELGEWETVADMTRIDERGVPARKILRALKKVHG